MIFSSLLFLFCFLPSCLLSYFVLPRRYRNFCLLFWSLLFYAWGAPKVMLVLLLSCAADYYLSVQIDKVDSVLARKRLLTIGMVINLGLLGWFKYTNFLVAEVSALLSALGYQAIEWSSIALPIGISFFTFQKMSYLVDIYRKTATRAVTLADYILYVTLFPQLIAGPIIRYHDVSAQIRKRDVRWDDFIEGIWRFCTGLAKKVLVADVLAMSADHAFNRGLPELTTEQAWVGLLCYTLQIYFDFSGYSDMAIGLGRMFGFHFLENFNYPYVSQNITEFWRRWHISLSNWMKEYLYIPLGGNRLGVLRTYLNLCLVFLLSGFWHGANWTFVVWGLWHGVLLICDRLFWLDVARRLPRLFNVVLCGVLVMFGWVFFRAESIDQALLYQARLLGVTHVEQLPMAWAELIDLRGWVMLLVGVVLATYPALFEGLNISCARLSGSSGQMLRGVVGYVCSLCLLLLSVMSLVSSSFHPFIYFRF